MLTTFNNKVLPRFSHSLDFRDCIIFKSMFTPTIPLDFSSQLGEIRIAPIDKDELLKRF